MEFKASQPDRLFLLDGMRGLAAFAVIADHVRSPAFESVLSGRYLAVDFFFVLSGLVLARSYGATLSSPAGILRFMKLRIVRLYPMYLLSLVLAVAVTFYSALGGSEKPDPAFTAISIGTNLLMLPSPATIGLPGGNLFPYVGAAWTLFFELVANAFWALTATFLRGRLRLLALAVFAVVAGYLVVVTPVLGAGWQWSYAHVGLARVLFSFLMGVTLHHLINHYRLPVVPVMIPFCLFVLVLVCPVAPAWRTDFDAFAMIVVIPVTVLLAARTQVASGIARICTWLGSVSYGVYIMHGPLYMVLLKSGVLVGLSAKWHVLIVAALAALVAHVAIKAYDTPVRRWLVSKVIRDGRRG